MGGTHGLSRTFTQAQIRCTQWHQLTESRTFFCEIPNGAEERGPVCCFSDCGHSWGQPNSGGKELNLEGFEMSEDKPCSDPWPNAQPYSTQRTPRSPGSEAVAAAMERKERMDASAAAWQGTANGWRWELAPCCTATRPPLKGPAVCCWTYS